LGHEKRSSPGLAPIRIALPQPIYNTRSWGRVSDPSAIPARALRAFVASRGLRPCLL